VVVQPSVVTQPGVVVQPIVVGANLGPQPKDHLVFSIITLICCNFLIGALATLFSVKSRSSWRSNNALDAKKFSSWALYANIFALILGALTWFGVAAAIIYRIVQAVIVASYYG
jgi:hypothetical protein